MKVLSVKDNLQQVHFTSQPLDGEFIRTAIRNQGYLFLPEVFGSAHMAELRTAMDKARTVEACRFGEDTLKQVGQDGYISDILAWGSAMEKLLASPLLNNIVNALLGTPRLYIGQGICLDPGKGGGIWPRCWHADMYQIRQQIDDPTYCFGVNCLVMVDQTTEENGATLVLPASHGMKEQRLDDANLEQMAFRAEGKAGSLLLLDGGVWHCAGVNNSKEIRRVIKLLFTRDWIKPQIDYNKVIPQDVKSRLNANTRALMRVDEAGL